MTDPKLRMMNRKVRRIEDATTRRTGAPSLALLQSQLQAMAQENSELRNVIFGILKEQGRVRLMKRTVDSLNAGDELVTRELPDCWVFELVQGNMVAEGGVRGGQAVHDEPEGG